MEARAMYQITPAPLPSDFEALERWGKLAKDAGILPKEINVAQAALMVQAGRELGLPPCQSLRSFYIVNGRLSMKVELQLALARKVGVKLAKLEEGVDYCQVTLVRGDESVTTRFSDEDAKRAGLLEQGYSWAKYPREMRRWRAIGAALRLIAPDVVLGLLSPEEAESIPPLEIETGEDALEAQAEQTEPQPAEVEPAAHQSDTNATWQELKPKLYELGFTTPEIRLVAKGIRQAGALPDAVSRVINDAQSKEEAVLGLRVLGVRFPKEV